MKEKVGGKVSLSSFSVVADTLKDIVSLMKSVHVEELFLQKSTDFSVEDVCQLIMNVFTPRTFSSLCVTVERLEDLAQVISSCNEYPLSKLNILSKIKEKGDKHEKLRK